MTTPQTPQLPPLPEPDAVFYCSEETGYLTQYRRPPANLTEGDMAMYDAETVRAYARAALEAQKAAAPDLVGLTDEQIDALWQDDELSMPNKVRRRIVASEAIALFCRINNLPTGTTTRSQQCK